MRVFHILVPKDKLYIVRTLLESLSLEEFSVCDARNCIVVVSVPDERAEEVSDGLQRIGLGTAFGTFMSFEAKQAPEIHAIALQQQKPVTQRAAKEELIEKISDQATLSSNYIIMTISAAILAAAGLLTNNLVLIIASMLIAPLMGPVMGTSLGIVLNLRELTRRSLISESVGILISVLVGFIIALIEPHPAMTEQIALRAFPSAYDILFALVAGLAAALSTVSLELMALVGVAIAASLLPPAVNVGVGLAFILRGVEEGLQVAVGSSILLMINVFAIAMVSTMFFWLVGVRPGESARKLAVAKRGLRKRLLLILILFLLSATPIVMTSLEAYKVRKLEGAIKLETEKFLNENFPEAKIVDISVRYLSNEKRAEVYLSVAVAEESYAKKIPEALAEHLQKMFNVDVEVYLSIYLYYSAHG